MRSIGLAARAIGARVDAARLRIETLSSIRSLVALPRASDISEQQWRAIESQFGRQQRWLSDRLERGTRELLPQFHRIHVQRKLNALLGRLELDLSLALTLFDTYMDVLTQRHAQPLGAMLAGCDVIAQDALRRNHPALLVIEPPLVCCNRGFGASTMREDIAFPGMGRNPMPIIQIPYSRLKEKTNLTSLLHEAGHEAMVRLNLRAALGDVLRRGALRGGAPAAVGDLFALWSSEIGPDVWGVGCAGIAAIGTVKEILALPPEHVYSIHPNDPHPPPYIRALLLFRLGRDLWGPGPWDRWREEWTTLYPWRQAAPGVRPLLRAAESVLPRVTESLINHKFPSLGNRALFDLFDLRPLAIAALERRITHRRARLKGLSPSAHLAVFRLLRDRGEMSERALDKLMTRWLLALRDRAARQDN